MTENKCDKCEYLSSEKRYLKGHIRRMHCLDGKNAKCDECEYSTYSPWRLKLHKQNKHNKDCGLRYLCDLCEHSCLQIREMNLHRKSDHGIQAKRALSAFSLHLRNHRKIIKDSLVYSSSQDILKQAKLSWNLVGEEEKEKLKDLSRKEYRAWYTLFKPRICASTNISEEDDADQLDDSVHDDDDLDQDEHEDDQHDEDDSDAEIEVNVLEIECSETTEISIISHRQSTEVGRKITVQQDEFISFSSSCSPGLSDQPTNHLFVQPLRQTSNQSSNLLLNQPGNHTIDQPSFEPNKLSSKHPTHQILNPSCSSFESFNQSSCIVQDHTSNQLEKSSYPFVPTYIQQSNQFGITQFNMLNNQQSTQYQPLKQQSNQPSNIQFNNPVNRESKESSIPSNQESSIPLNQESRNPSNHPSNHPSNYHSNQQSNHSSIQQSSNPSMYPSNHQSINPSKNLPSQSSTQPLKHPSIFPLNHIRNQPSNQSFSHPSHHLPNQSSYYASEHPFNPSSDRPSNDPSSDPLNQHLSQPSKDSTSLFSNQALVQTSSEPVAEQRTVLETSTFKQLTNAKRNLFPCEQCDYSTEKRSNLFRHMNSQHLKVQNFCDICDFSTPHSSYLKRHLKLHSSEKTESVVKKAQHRSSFLKFCAEKRDEIKGKLSINFRIVNSRLVNQELGKAWKLLDEETKLKYTIKTKPNPTLELTKKCPRNPFALFVREYFADLRKDPKYLNISSRDVYRKAGAVWARKSPVEKKKYCFMFVEERRKM